MQFKSLDSIIETAAANKKIIETMKLHSTWSQPRAGCHDQLVVGDLKNASYISWMNTCRPRVFGRI